MHVKERDERKTCPTTCPSGSLRSSRLQGLHRWAFPRPRWRRHFPVAPLRANSFNRCGARLRLTGLGRPPLNRVFRRASQSREDWACKGPAGMPALFRGTGMSRRKSPERDEKRRAPAGWNTRLPFSFAYFFWAGKRNRLAASRMGYKKGIRIDRLRNLFPVII